MTLQDSFDAYIKHGLYLRGWSPKTAVIYKRAFTSFQRSLQESAVSEPREGGSPHFSKASLEAWIIRRREAGMSPAGINIYIRAINAFSAWLKEEGHAGEQIILKQLKAPQKAVYVFSEADIRSLIGFKPRTRAEWRIHVLTQTLLDTGCRINEVVGLAAAKVDMDNLLLSVDGKGNKERRIPFSGELRKVLFRYGQLKEKWGVQSSFVFCSRDGNRLMYRNVYRDLINLCRRLGITKRVHPHLTRHTFACHFMRNGGSIYTLSRILGHSSVSTTQIYVRGLGVEDFREEHARLSPLSHLHGR
jgi:integrase/recombinase XerD